MFPIFLVKASLECEQSWLVSIHPTLEAAQTAMDELDLDYGDGGDFKWIVKLSGFGLAKDVESRSEMVCRRRTPAKW